MKNLAKWIVWSLALLAFLAPLKFGMPVVSQSLLVPPQELFEWVFSSWPNQLATMFTFAAVLWLVLDENRLRARVDLQFALPVLFLATQAATTMGSIAPQTSVDTLLHFAACALLFYAAAWYVRDGAAAVRIFGGIGLAVFLIIILALEQRYGGLQQTRDFAALYLDLAAAPPDLLLRMTTNRVFATFVYPNALAGFLVLAFAPTLAWIWVRARNWDARVKWGTLTIMAGLMVFCLTLTGSRGGYIAFVAMVLAGLLCLVPKGSRRAGWVIGALVTLALVFVLAQRGGLISKGTESVQSRRDYWRGAVAITRDHPWLGTGPGTFGSIYPQYKTAASEEAQMVHNNFLQMWSDSGVLAFLVFALIWLVAIRDSFELARRRYGDAAAIAICAALSGWVVHALVDFDLYVPGVAIPAFLILGTLQGLKELPRVRAVRPPGAMKWALMAVCGAVVAVVFFIEGRHLAASFQHGQARALRYTDPGRALAAGRRAVALAPRNAYYEAVAGDLAVDLGRFSEAIEWYSLASASDPYRASYHWRLARVLVAQNDRITEKAIGQLQQAAELNPTNQRYQNDLAAAKESVRQSSRSLLESVPARQDQ
jgi:O-antigen ligase